MYLEVPLKFAHIADTHIRNLKYHKEYKEVFNKIYESLKKERVDYIIHCGAEIYDDNLMFESNVVLTYKILELVKNLSNVENFVYIGSSSEYGRKLKPMKEDDVLEPDTMYEGTKACGSLLTRVYGKTYNMMTSIVRPFSLYGKNEKLPPQCQKEQCLHLELFSKFLHPQLAKYQTSLFCEGS